jgi:hypothetical protein
MTTERQAVRNTVNPEIFSARLRGVFSRPPFFDCPDKIGTILHTVPLLIAHAHKKSRMTNILSRLHSDQGILHEGLVSHSMGR